MQIVLMKFGELCGPKDYAEKTSCDGTVTTEKISCSTKMLFLFILTLPVSALISVIGLGCEKISTTYDRKIKAFAGSVEQEDEKFLFS